MFQDQLSPTPGTPHHTDDAVRRQFCANHAVSLAITDPAIAGPVRLQ